MPAPWIHTRKYASAFVRLRGRFFRRPTNALHAVLGWHLLGSACGEKKGKELGNWSARNVQSILSLSLSLSLPSLPPLSKLHKPHLPAKVTGMLCQLFASSDFLLRRQDSKCSAALRAHAKQSKASGKLSGKVSKLHQSRVESLRSHKGICPKQPRSLF